MKEEYQQGYDDALSDVLKLCSERRKIAEMYSMTDVIKCWERLEVALTGQLEVKAKND
jgi:hypothetical protein